MNNLYILMGPPGSGKTTYAKTIENAIYLSTDELRKELLGKELTLRKQTYIHNTLKNRMLRYLLQGKNVIIDCSNLRIRQREKYFQFVPRNTRTILMYIKTPLLTCLKNNLKRKRHVPEIGLIFMHIITQKPKITEKFDIIKILKNNKEILIKGEDYDRN